MHMERLGLTKQPDAGRALKRHDGAVKSTTHVRCLAEAAVALRAAARDLPGARPTAEAEEPPILRLLFFRSPLKLVVESPGEATTIAARIRHRS